MIRAALVLLALGALPAAAACGPRDAILGQIEGTYHEARIGAGLQSETRLIEVWVSPEGTWTVIATTAGGATCVIASGRHWLIYPAPIPGEDG